MAANVKSAAVEQATDAFTDRMRRQETMTGKTRTAMRHSLTDQAGQLARLRDELAHQLGTQYAWLVDHENHPRFQEFEDRWIADLTIYERAADAVAAFSLQLEIAA
jgi:hypothetical protein